MCIRTAANTASAKCKAKFRDDEAELNKDINDVVDELSQQSDDRDRTELLKHKLDDLRQLKRCLVEKIGARLERRTARKWYNEGELSNKYFFNLLNRKIDDEVKGVINSEGNEVTDLNLIEEEIRNFASSLKF